MSVIVMTRYCLPGSRAGTTFPRASPPVTTASLSTALQAGPLHVFVEFSTSLSHALVSLEGCTKRSGRSPGRSPGVIWYGVTVWKTVP